MGVLAAAPWSDDLFVGGDDDGTAHVFSLGRRQEVASFPTVYEGRGRRIALVPGAPPVVVAGAWTRSGVCGYDALAGRLLWRRPDLRRVQQIRALTAELAGVRLEGQPACVLSVSTGREMARSTAVRQVLALSSGRSLLAGQRWVAVADADLAPVRRVPLESFAVVDGALSPEGAAVSEAGGILRILGPAGDVVGRWAGPAGSVGQAAWDKAGQRWLCVARPALETACLLRLSPDAGTADRLGIGQVRSAAFFGDGCHLAVARFGAPRRAEVLLTDTGTAEWEVDASA
jgi:hypothetical protein